MHGNTCLRTYQSVGPSKFMLVYVMQNATVRVTKNLHAANFNCERNHLTEPKVQLYTGTFSAPVGCWPWPILRRWPHSGGLKAAQPSAISMPMVTMQQLLAS